MFADQSLGAVPVEAFGGVADSWKVDACWGKKRLPENHFLSTPNSTLPPVNITIINVGMRWNAIFHRLETSKQFVMLKNITVFPFPLIG